MEAYGSDDTVAVFQDALSNNVDSNKYDYLFLMDAGISSLVLSNLQNLTIPGSKLNTYGNTCDNRLGDDHILTLTKGLLAARIQLQTLSLRNHFISDIGFDLICSEIIEKRKLLELDLEGNNISGAGTGISGLRLDAADTSLTSLNLSCNPLITAAGMAIANALRTNHVLTKISLNNCGFNLNVIVAIATTLRQNVALEVLKLDRPLTDKLTKQEHGLDHLSRLMDGPLSRISHLTLRYHCVEDYGARLLASSLKTNKSLTYLDLERNKIGPSGCEAIASHLILQPSTGCVLKTLLLSYNQVGNEGAKALAQVLIHNKSFKNLSLKNNNINEEGLLVLGEAIIKNNTLKTLSIFGNNFTHKAGELFSVINNNRKTNLNLNLDVQIYRVDKEYMTAEKKM